MKIDGYKRFLSVCKFNKLSSSYTTTFISKIIIIENKIYLSISVNEGLQKLVSYNINNELIKFIHEKKLTKFLQEETKFKLLIPGNSIGVLFLKDLLDGLYQFDYNILIDNTEIKKRNILLKNEFVKIAKDYGFKLNEKELENQIKFDFPDLLILSNVINSTVEGFNIEIKKFNENNFNSNQQKMNYTKELEDIYNKVSTELNYSGDVNVKSINLFILEKDKYLNLAVASESVRQDWNQGCYKIKKALDSFQLDNIQDEEIYADYVNCINSFEFGNCDGRIFRDTKYSYSFLYSRVNPKILFLYNLLQNFIEKYH